MGDGAASAAQRLLDEIALDGGQQVIAQVDAIRGQLHRPPSSVGSLSQHGHDFPVLIQCLLGFQLRL